MSLSTGTDSGGGGLLRTEVPAALAGERVDRVVATLTSLSRSGVAALVGAEAVRIGGVAVRQASRRVAEGDLLEVDLPVRRAVDLVADPSVVVTVVHADASVIVVDKPAGLVVHPGAGHPSGTLVQGLLARYPELALVGDEDRPGIVHRLDRPTSGLLVVARTPEALAILKAQLARRSMSRRYLALVWGRVEALEGIVDAPIGRSERDPTRMAVVNGGRSARTGYQVLRRLDSPATTLLECRLETGRTHQIRVHLAAIGHPLLGDDRYGADQRSATRAGLARDWPALGRVWLHAHSLSFDHPQTGERLSFTSPLPPELATVLHSLEPPSPPTRGTTEGGPDPEAAVNSS